MIQFLVINCILHGNKTQKNSSWKTLTEPQSRAAKCQSQALTYSIHFVFFSDASLFCPLHVRYETILYSVCVCVCVAICCTCVYTHEDRRCYQVTCSTNLPYSFEIWSSFNLTLGEQTTSKAQGFLTLTSHSAGFADIYVSMLNFLCGYLPGIQTQFLVPA